MKKLNRLQIGKYEIVDEIIEGDEKYEYEEITVQELLNKNNYDEIEQKQFVNTYNAINIHFMLAGETFNKAIDLILNKDKEERLNKLNAIVFLSLKKKGRAKDRYTQLSKTKFRELVTLAINKGVPIGFDSCSAFKFMESVDNDKKYEPYIEPCESSLFSSYFNVKGDFYPCSFMEGEADWKEGIKLEDINNFLKDLWHNEKVVDFRNKVIACRSCKQSCVHYKI